MALTANVDKILDGFKRNQLRRETYTSYSTPHAYNDMVTSALDHPYSRVDFRDRPQFVVLKSLCSSSEE